MAARSDTPSGSAPKRPRRAIRPCPICAKASVEAYRPFCSKRCADVDLGRWLTGRYAIAAENQDDPERAGEADPDASDQDMD
jgi:hypothetical protein